MASKWQTCRLSETQDRRVKLTKAKKEEIARKFETGEYSLRGLAREYNVSHKTISLIVDQRAKRKNDEYNRTHWMYYRPDAETMREAHRKSKEYKKRLYEKGELK
ncbi:MAG: hypothetical protein ACLT1R_02165 [Lachnospiraceae bacterium]|nr:MAG TPA: PROTEIN/RNA Complex ribosome, large subunit, protein-RNA.2A [Caudoviricetes sp.]DAZ71230.1 MAG TPA: PROTEIN/RNA Complex ribosome, large subunit, protein-RNA.2A [Caudoviricetes sp.]